MFLDIVLTGERIQLEIPTLCCPFTATILRFGAGCSLKRVDWASVSLYRRFLLVDEIGSGLAEDNGEPKTSVIGDVSRRFEHVVDDALPEFFRALLSV